MITTIETLIIMMSKCPGIYSQRIFSKLGHTTLTSVNYDDFRAADGELYLQDTREHTNVITCFKKIV